MIKEFTLGAVKWTVEINNDRTSDREAYGTTLPSDKKILLASREGSSILSKDSIEQTMYHEVVHAILHTLGEYELYTNEPFVQSFSVLLHQFERSKK